MIKLVKKIKQQKGLGLMEAIIALAIIITGIVSGLTLTSYNLTASSASEKQLLAVNLAREGIEVIRQKRDSNWLAGNDWNQGIITAGNYRLTVNFDSSTGSWTTASQTQDLDACDSCKIYLDNSAGVYSHNSDGESTNYKRLLILQDICWQDSVSQEAVLATGETCSSYGYELVGWQITSQVNWLEAGRSHELSFIDQLYDWR